MPGALCPQVVKELRRRHYSLMINSPYTLPLPDLSKQGRAEEQEAEGGEKAEEESLSYSNCTSTLKQAAKQLQEDIPSPAGQGAEQTRGRTGPHTLLHGCKGLSLGLLTPCFCKPVVTVPHTAVKVTATTQGRSFLFVSAPIAASSHTNWSPMQSHQQPVSSSFAGLGICTYSKGPTTGPRRHLIPGCSKALCIHLGPMQLFNATRRQFEIRDVGEEGTFSNGRKMHPYFPFAKGTREL